MKQRAARRAPLGALQAFCVLPARHTCTVRKRRPIRILRRTECISGGSHSGWAGGEMLTERRPRRASPSARRGPQRTADARARSRGSAPKSS
jgi:hypothetical protein